MNLSKVLNGFRDIVRSLKGFARIDEKDISSIDLHEALDSVLKIAAAEIKLCAQIEKNYCKKLPLFEGKVVNCIRFFKFNYECSASNTGRTDSK